MTDANGYAVYLDSSALVKLVVREAESDALIGHLVDHVARVASALVRVEVIRAVRAHGTSAVRRAQRLMGGLRLLALDDALLDAAAGVDDERLRSLDAIHLAAALSFGDDLLHVVTYDLRMAEAARSVGLRCLAPG